MGTNSRLVMNHKIKIKDATGVAFIIPTHACMPPWKKGNLIAKKARRIPIIIPAERPRKIRRREEPTTFQKLRFGFILPEENKSVNNVLKVGMG